LILNVVSLIKTKLVTAPIIRRNEK